MADTPTKTAPPLLKSFFDATDEAKDELIQKAPTATPAMWQALLEKHNITPATLQSTISKLSAGETLPKEEATKAVQTVNWNDFNPIPELHHGHAPHAHTFEPDMLTPEMQNDANYKRIHEELKAKKNIDWEKNKEKITKKWEKENKLNINSKEGQDFL